MTYPHTAKQRRVTCVHEAAHAVMFALGGVSVYRVAVAPVGSTDWTVQGRKGGTYSDLRGVCQASDSGAEMFLHYTPDEYGADRAGFRKYLALVGEAMRGRVRPEAMRRETYRRIRAHVCATLAGNAAEDLLQGEDPWPREHDCGGRPDDAAIAEMLAWLLPYRREVDRLHDLTAETLRRPEVWARVLALADELDAAGDLDDDRLDRHLPQPLRNWPRPGAKTK